MILGRTCTNITEPPSLVSNVRDFFDWFYWMLSTFSVHIESVTNPPCVFLGKTHLDLLPERPCSKSIMTRSYRHTSFCKTNRTGSILKPRARLVQRCCSPSVPYKSPSAINLFYVSCFVADKKSCKLLGRRTIFAKGRQSKTSVGYECGRGLAVKKLTGPFSGESVLRFLKAISASNNSLLAWLGRFLVVMWGYNNPPTETGIVSWYTSLLLALKGTGWRRK